MIGQRLEELGFGLEFGEREWPRSWRRLANIDLLLLLGSDWSANDNAHRNSVVAEISLIHSATMIGIPTFGICFGAQIISLAGGGTVWRSNPPEIGWTEVTSNRYPNLFEHTWFQWHYDVFSASAGVEVVASNETGAQAILGKRLLGTQFHPEATLEIITRWTQGNGSAELLSVGLSPSDVTQISSRWVHLTRERTNKIVDWFLESSNSF